MWADWDDLLIAARIAVKALHDCDARRDLEKAISEAADEFQYDAEVFSRGKAARWRPIETAPKDGTHILGWDGNTQTTVKWWQWHGGRGYWDLVEWGAYAEDGEGNPTHWMPLPDPPKE